MISARTTTGAAVSVQAEQIERNIEMTNIELTSKNGKVHAEISEEVKEALAKSGIDIEKEMQSIVQHEEDELTKLGKRDHVTRREYNALRFFLVAIVFATALLAWRLNQKNNENIQNLVKICDKVGVEYSVETNHIGLRNRIILLTP